MLALVERVVPKVALFLLPLCAAHAQEEVVESFDVSPPPGWELGGAIVRGGALTLRSRGTATAPHEWQDFELVLATSLEGAVEVRYADGLVLRAGSGRLAFVEPGPRGASELAGVVLDPRGPQTQIVLRVERGVHTAEVPGVTEQVRLERRGPRGRIAFGTVMNQVTQVFDVRIRSLAPAEPVLVKVVPKEVQRGSEASLFLVGEALPAQATPRFSPGGVEWLDSIAHAPGLVELLVSIAPDAPLGARSLSIPHGRRREARLERAFTVVLAPVPPEPPPAPPELPEVHRVEPPLVVAGEAATLTLVGRGLGHVARVRAEDPPIEGGGRPAGRRGGGQARSLGRARVAGGGRIRARRLLRRPGTSSPCRSRWPCSRHRSPRRSIRPVRPRRHS